MDNKIPALRERATDISKLSVTQTILTEPYLMFFSAGDPLRFHTHDGPGFNQEVGVHLGGTDDSPEATIELNVFAEEGERFLLDLSYVTPTLAGNPFLRSTFSFFSDTETIKDITLTDNLFTTVTPIRQNGACTILAYGCHSCE